MTMPQNGTESSGWTVTGQSPGQTQVTPDGRVISGTLVYFRTGNGTMGNVFVPQDRYNAETVRTMIAVVAREMDSIDGLQG